jgi:hypothetical protein
MLESWTVVNDNTARQQTHFDPVIPNTNVKHDKWSRDSGPSKDDYIKYNWLFGNR